jgi:hypothetical protein
MVGVTHTHFRIRHEHVNAEERFTVALSDLSSMACLQKYTPRKNSNRKNSMVRNRKLNITYRRGQNFAACRGEALIFLLYNFIGTMYSM